MPEFRRPHNINDPFSVSEKYLYMRKQGFILSTEALKITGLHPDQVYGVICDMPIGSNVLGTLVCYINGAANLYFNNGSAIEGVCAKYLRAAEITNAFVRLSAEGLQFARQVKAYPLPVGFSHFVYFLTLNGIYKLDFVPQKITEPVIRRLFAGEQAVMREIRLAQLKEQAKNSK